MERINRLYLIIGLVIAFGFFYGIAQADDFDQATTITFSAPVQIPGKVLSAGTYLFKLADTESGLNVVQVFNSEGTVLYGTFETISTDRPKPTSDSALTLVEQESGKPDALLKWFYPGSLTGNEFVYPRAEEKEIVQDVQRTIVANAANTSPDAQAGD